MSMISTSRCMFFAATLVAATPLAADEISDSLQNALEAYQEGDLAYAMDELDFARQLMLSQKTDMLSAFLPDAPEGWERTLNDEISAGLAMMGGGVGAEAEYDNGSQDVTVTIMADNPMVSSMAAMLANASAFGGKLVRLGREKFMVQEDETQGMIDGRILVKAEGGDPEARMALLEAIDFNALKDYGR